jgi:hypothetical protein
MSQQVEVITTKPCPVCRLTSEVIMPLNAYTAWKGGQVLQQAWPEGSLSERELLITGAHDLCFKRMTREPVSCSSCSWVGEAGEYDAHIDVCEEDDWDEDR